MKRVNMNLCKHFAHRMRMQLAECECAHEQEEVATSQALSGTMCVVECMTLLSRWDQIWGRHRVLPSWQTVHGLEYLYLREE